MSEWVIFQSASPDRRSKTDPPLLYIDGNRLVVTTILSQVGLFT
jgi:hypothetical protein